MLLAVQTYSLALKIQALFSPKMAYILHYAFLPGFALQLNTLLFSKNVCKLPPDLSLHICSSYSTLKVESVHFSQMASSFT
jgi:hypothetical protein